MASHELHNPSEVPIACSLSPTDFRQRQRDVASVASHALRSRSSITGGERLVFTLTDDTERQLERVVAAEGECCPFLTMDLRRHGEHLVLDVTGPGDALAIIEELFA